MTTTIYPEDGGCGDVSFEGHHGTTQHNLRPKSHSSTTASPRRKAADFNQAGDLLQLTDQLAQGRERFGFGDLLPPPLAAALALVQESLPTDPLTAVLVLLTGYSGLLKLGTRVASSHDFSVPAALWTAPVMVSGGAKSPIKRALIDAPAAQIRLQAKQAYERAMRNWQDACTGIPKADRPPAPRPRFVHLADYTPEALASQLELHEPDGLGLLIIRDELSGLLSAIANESRTGRGTAEAQLLETFDGDGTCSIRVGAGARSYERCHVALYGAIQPQKLKELINGEDATGKFARFLFVRVPARPLSLRIDDPTPAERTAYTEATEILEQFALGFFRLPPTIYQLDRGARERFVPWFEQHQRRALSPATPGVISAMLGKTSAHALRLAGVMRIAWRLHDKSDDTNVGADLMQVAMAVVDQLVAETELFHDAPASAGTLLMQHVHQLSENHGNRPVSWTMAKAKGSRRIRELSADDYYQAVDQLIVLGYGQLDGQGHYAAVKPMPAW